MSERLTRLITPLGFGYDGAQKSICEAECDRLRTQFGLHHVCAFVRSGEVSGG